MNFSEHETRVATGSLRFFAAGAGRPLLYLNGAADARPGRPLQSLAETFRIYLPILPELERSGTRGGGVSTVSLADLVASFIAAEIAAPCDVIGHSFGSEVALLLAARHPKSVGQIILEAPIHGVEGHSAAPLADVAALALVLVGARDEAASTRSGRLLKAQLPRSYLIYVHDAARDIEADQPVFFERVVRDFLEWGEGFLIKRNRGAA